MKRILVGTDFSAAGSRAVQVAVAWARRAGAALRIVHVVPPKRWLIGVWRTDRATVSAIQVRARTALKHLVETRDPDRKIEMSTGLLSGAASVTIARAARDFQADLVIVGARGEHEGLLLRPKLGGTSTKLLSTTSTPLLLVRTAAAEAPSVVVAALDLSPVSADVLKWARMSVTPEGRIDVFHAFETPFGARLDAYGVARESIDVYSDEERTRREHEIDVLIAVGGGGASVRRIVERGDAGERLFELIQQAEPSLIVLGKHAGRRGRGTAKSSGSVALHTAFFAPSNVLIVTPAA